jgi:hypothetical protein
VGNFRQDREGYSRPANGYLAVNVVEAGKYVLMYTIWRRMSRGKMGKTAKKEIFLARGKKGFWSGVMTI